MGTPAIRKRLKRWEEPGDWRYLTCSTYRRFQYFDEPGFKDIFAEKLEAARCKCGFELRAWVLMPEHFHIMLKPNIGGPKVPEILKSLKVSVSQSLLPLWKKRRPDLIEHARLDDGSLRVWQAGGGFDRNVRDNEEMEYEIIYIHNNPVRKGFVKEPTEWAWSSARHYAGDATSPAQIVYRKWTPYRDQPHPS